MYVACRDIYDSDLAIRSFLRGELCYRILDRGWQPSDVFVSEDPKQRNVYQDLYLQALQHVNRYLTARKVAPYNYLMEVRFQRNLLWLQIVTLSNFLAAEKDTKAILQKYVPELDIEATGKHPKTDEQTKMVFRGSFMELMDEHFLKHLSAFTMGDLYFYWRELQREDEEVAT